MFTIQQLGIIGAVLFFGLGFVLDCLHRTYVRKRRTYTSQMRVVEGGELTFYECRSTKKARR